MRDSKASLMRRIASVPMLRRAPARYGMAVLLIAAATGARYLLEVALHINLPFATYFLAVVVIAWLGGFGPAIAGTALGAAAAVILFVLLGDGVPWTSAETLRLVMFCCLGPVIATFSELQRRAVARAEAEARDADQRRQQLEQQVEEGRRVEAALRDSEQRFEAVANLAPVMIWMAGLDKKCTYLSQQRMDFTGRSVKEGLDDGWMGSVHPDDAAQCAAEFSAAFDARSEFRMEFRLKRKDGEYRWVLDAGVPRHGEGGVFLGYVGSCIDITARKQAEQALRESETRARSILATAVDAFITIDSRGMVESFNPAAERLFGYGAAEVIGRNVIMLMPSPYRQEHDGYLKRYFETGLARIIGIGREVQGMKKDGTVFPMRLSVGEMRLGERRMFTGTVQDVTQWKEVEQELLAAKESAEAARRSAEAANRMKDEFLATLSHELRTPLNAMLGWARLLRQGNLDAETTGRAMEAIERNATTQAKLIEDLLDVSRIISGKLQLDVKPVDLKAVTEAALDAVRPAAEARGIQLVPVVNGAACMVAGDATRLQQVVWNLLSNAVKFTLRGGRVEAELSCADSEAQVMVRDTGKGISADFLPYVFDRFRQADVSAGRPQGGLGLGLSIVRHLVELHGGTVEARSEGEGKGASFFVRLPLSGARPAIVPTAPLHAGQVTAVLRGVRVLVIDDEADARQLLEAVLGQCQAEVLIASSSEDAVRIVREQKPDILISDIGMPGDDGYRLIRRVRALPEAEGGRTPAIALTAFARLEDRIKALEAGYQMHLAKPIEPAELVAAVAGMVVSKAPAR